MSSLIKCWSDIVWTIWPCTGNWSTKGSTGSGLPYGTIKIGTLRHGHLPVFPPGLTSWKILGKKLWKCEIMWNLPREFKSHDRYWMKMDEEYVDSMSTYFTYSWKILMALWRPLEWHQSSRNCHQPDGRIQLCHLRFGNGVPPLFQWIVIISLSNGHLMGIPYTRYTPISDTHFLTSFPCDISLEARTDAMNSKCFPAWPAGSVEQKTTQLSLQGPYLVTCKGGLFLCFHKALAAWRFIGTLDISMALVHFG
jgi:hypothetical protein